jgi:ABC-2 type transport system ATP-binding protein
VAASHPAVRFEKATKRFGGLLALDALDLSIAPGSLFALVGPNGAGKTTALGLLTGLLAPTAGRTLVAGFDVAAEPLEAKKRLAFVPDRPLLWPRWTPRETLRFVGAVFGLAGAGLEERIDGELASHGLRDVADARNETLSHGTRQRVALAQAFLHDPPLYVLDEPMVGLDPLAQRTLAERLREKASAGAAVLFTTHQLSVAEELASDAGLLVGGRLAARGAPRAMRGERGASGLSAVFFEHVDGASG